LPLDEVLANVDHFVYRIDFQSGRFDYLSPAVAPMLGTSLDDLLARGHEALGQFMDGEDRRRCWADITGACSAHPGETVVLRFEYGVTDAAGRRRRYSDSIKVVSDDDGSPLWGYGIASDVTSRWEAEKALRESEALFRSTMGASQVGIFVLQDGKFRYVNPWLLRQFGYAEEEIVDRLGPVDLVAPEHRDYVAEQVRRRAAGEPGKGYEVLALRKDGSVFPAMVLGAPSVYLDRPASVGTLLDISERKWAEEQLRELAYYDSLTGLPNRRLLEDRLRQALGVAERDGATLALFFIDIDHFKRVNDSLGHTAGDELLCAVAERLGTVVRKIDSLGRLGGDEFIALLPGVSAAEAAEVASRMIKAFAEPFRLGEHDLTVTPSFGISLYPGDGKDFETLLKNSDTAMYRAKEAGRNGFQFYSRDMNVATLEHLMLESSLRNALPNGELTLHYQPLVALETGRIVGVEALIRWRHPQIGMISPARFIPVAEDTGIINAIGDWVLFEVCRQAMAWQAAGIPPLTVAVNVSPVQFRQTGFVDVVAGALAYSGLEPAFLELELTERTVMHDAEVNLGTLSALHRMGVELAVDDFGTGYSSLAYLKRFPVNKLKIDQSFVRHVVEDTDDQAIASTIVSIGKSLRLTVLAEGVETKAQLAWLCAQRCDFAQGYHFSPPLPPEDMAAMLRRQPFLTGE
jgi:diguanylate cyclase (GGDEF)-like protein/PAS domain S-box-containing protein